MQVPDSPNTPCFSPKRKRDAYDSSMIDAPSPSRVKTTNLPIRSLTEDEILSGGSPRTTVAGHLRDLDLESQNDIPKLDCHIQDGTQPRDLKAGFGSGALNSHLFPSTKPYSSPVTPPSSSDGPISGPSQTGNNDLITTNLSLEIPETPRLRPVSSPTPPPSVKKARLPKSPPPTPSSPALWWSDTEITGHDPKDPSDDGYGINGIGFLPTPAIANARAERRKKQVAEWKIREAREARQKRSDRRRRRDAEIGPAGGSLGQSENGLGFEKERRVRFLEI